MDNYVATTYIYYSTKSSDLQNKSSNEVLPDLLIPPHTRDKSSLTCKIIRYPYGMPSFMTETLHLVSHSTAGKMPITVERLLIQIYFGSNCLFLCTLIHTPCL